MRFFLAAYVIGELLAFIAFTQWLGFGWTILLYVALALCGFFAASMVMRTLLVRTLGVVRAQRMRPSAQAITSRMALNVLGALLFLVPGVISTVLACIMLFPPLQPTIARILGAAVLSSIKNRLSLYITRISPSSTPDTMPPSSSYSHSPSSEQEKGWGPVIDHRDDEFSMKNPKDHD